MNKPLLELYQLNFNTLPFETRKGLPDTFTRWQEVTKLIREQELILNGLKLRADFLMKQLVEWWKQELNDMRKYEP